MNTFLVYLVITMSSNTYISYKGYGGVSVTPVPNMEVCQQLKQDTYNQLESHDKIDIDDVKIECKLYKF